MKSKLLILIILCSIFSCTAQEKRILVFSKTKGYRHQSIATGKLALIDLGKKNGFAVDTTESAELINETNLKKYNAVVFLSTSANVLNTVQQTDFKRFIEAGGGYVGIHAAADTEYEWPWYGKLAGAYFKSHPKIQEAKFRKAKDHPFTANLPAEWVRKDELYNYKNISKDINVLYTLDESSYQGGENGENHPITWYHEFEGGRSFYTGMGHTKESYAEPLFLELLLQGIRYAISEKKPDYSKARSPRAPEENRFTKTVLDFNLDEPTEMAILPDGKIIFTERKGNVKLYTPADGKVKIIDSIKVATKFEDGIIGIQADPGFSKNKWIYIFYSHPERSANVLSRFVFANDKIDRSSEKQLLEVLTQREQCCHTGGSLLFGPDGNLYISTGDNTSPFESNGFSPSDERPGRAPFDAQKSSSNTNDLRGKILRIRLQPDGTYTIPEGNLFPKGEPKTRPEIYAMGTRNPYRISIDEKTGYLYWGEVGPDAGQNDSIRGSRGYDEVNQAKKAGFFGWPYFVGNNYPYAKYDFVTKTVGPLWDANKPINESPNNTGKRELPPVSPAFIYYPYAPSEEFPMFKEGGRNAMAGPVYYREKFKGIKTAFPDYFNGKLIIYDWMRNWIFLVTMDMEGGILDIEPFMENTKFNNIIDMAFGPDGKLYMLEYGTKWFKPNLDARLVRIDFNPGNRPPVAMLETDKLAGSVPLTVKFTTKGTYDPDVDKIRYQLIAGEKTYESTDGNFSVTFDKPGVHTVEFKATDAKGASHSAKQKISAGNEPPVVKTEFVGGNKTFFFPATTVKYVVQVSDKEDGTTENGDIPGESVRVTFDFLKGFDMTAIAQGHQMPTAELPGKALIEKSDCKSCHLVDQKSAGPSYKDMAMKYKPQKDVKDPLAAKIIKGGSGVWGPVAMAAHPQITEDEAKKMIDYILSLGEEKTVKQLPLSGTVETGNDERGAYLLTATYADKGAKSVPSLSSTNTTVLRSPILLADQANELRGAKVIRINKVARLENIKHNNFALYRNIDITDLKKIAVTTRIEGNHTAGGEIEIHLDKPDGQLLGKTVVSAGISAITLEPADGFHDLYIVFKNPEGGNGNLFYFESARLSNQ